ncbi:BTB/POZ domain-containing protein 6-like [Montipora foliosa]|uniref:BTB/POZ domain-containing protein 6-like n=1 Tax=Montipora foliosa TaxID=591990 RepID=UPI0035F114CA
MSVRQENWQTKKPTIRERSKFMFNNHLFSDVKFVVRKSDGQSESKQAIPAHKLMLSIGSPVFEAMFYGDLAETSDSIELPDCEYDVLLELFRYLYSDEVNLSGSNVMKVLYLAKKYFVPSLAVKCTEYLQDHLHPSNVFNILVSARKYDEEQLVDRCWEMIDKQTSAAVKSERFAMIKRPLLEELVERDTLDIPEVELFKGVVRWADMEVARRTMVADGEEKRKVIGERIMKAIRFPIMKQDEFAFVVMDSKILSYDEVSTLIKYFNSKDSFPIEFPVSKRSGPLRKKTKQLENDKALVSPLAAKKKGRKVRYEESPKSESYHGGMFVEGRDGLVWINR